MMYSAYKLNKQGDNIQPCTPFTVLNQSFVPRKVLTGTSWPAHRFLRWSGIPISLRIFYVYCDPHSQRLSHSQWSRSRCFTGIHLLSLWSNKCQMLANWSLVPLPFLNPSYSSGNSQVLLKPSLEDFEHSLTSMGDRTTAQQFEHSLAWPFFGIRMKADFFQSCSPCWVFQICWHIECSTLTALSFRIWNSSAGIPSPPLALLVVMFSKAHLTSHSRMSGCRWVTTSLWSPWSLRPFYYSSSVNSGHLF